MGAPITDEDRENTRLRVQKWRLNHPEENKERNREYASKKYWKDPDKARELSNNQRAKNPEKARDRVKRWSKLHPEYSHVMNTNNRLKKALLAAATIQTAFTEMANQTKGETE